MSSRTQNPSAVIAAHRFGLGEARLDGVGNDPQGWLLAQIGPADAQVGDRLLVDDGKVGLVVTGIEGNKLTIDFLAG